MGKKKYTWQWLSDSGWTDFDKTNNSHLETQYKKHKTGSTTITVSGNSYNITFSDMMQENTSSQKKRQIQRIKAKSEKEEESDEEEIESEDEFVEVDSKKTGKKEKGKSSKDDKSKGKKEKKALQLREFSKSDEIVTLNVGGQLFTTLLSTLKSVENSNLYKILFPMDSSQVEKDENGAIFLDRPPECFEIILDSIRNNCQPPELDDELKEKNFKKELEFFGLKKFWPDQEEEEEEDKVKDKSKKKHKKKKEESEEEDEEEEDKDNENDKSKKKHKKKEKKEESEEEEEDLDEPEADDGEEESDDKEDGDNEKSASITKGKWRFDLADKSNSLVSEKGKAVKHTSSGYGVCYIKQKLSGKSKVSWSIKIKTMTNYWICLGVASESRVKSKNFGWNTVGHYTYGLSSNGFTWHHDDSNQNSKNSGISYGAGDVVTVNLDGKAKTLIFKCKSKSSNVVLTKVPTPCYPCVMMYYSGDEVKLVKFPSASDDQTQKESKEFKLSSPNNSTDFGISSDGLQVVETMGSNDLTNSSVFGVSSFKKDDVTIDKLESDSDSSGLMQGLKLEREPTSDPPPLPPNYHFIQ